MKIDDKTISYEINKYIPKSTPNPAEQIGERQFSDGKKAAAIDQPDNDTVVSLSRASKEAQQIKEIIASEPDIREEKVSALRDKIESGSYEIDHEAIGDKLVDAFIDDIFNL